MVLIKIKYDECIEGIFALEELLEQSLEDEEHMICRAELKALKIKARYYDEARKEISMGNDFRKI